MLSSTCPHIFPGCFNAILPESRVNDGIQHDYVEFRCIQYTGKGFRECLNADILCSAAKAKSLLKNTMTQNKLTSVLISPSQVKISNHSYHIFVHTEKNYKQVYSFHILKNETVKNCTIQFVSSKHIKSN